jgi:hypothetical protein
VEAFIGATGELHDLAILAAAWVANIWFFLTPAASLEEFVERATIGPIPGVIVISMGLIYNLGLLAIGIATVRLQEASGEVLPRYFTSQEMGTETVEKHGVLGKAQAWHKPAAPQTIGRSDYYRSPRLCHRIPKI